MQRSAMMNVAHQIETTGYVYRASSKQISKDFYMHETICIQLLKYGPTKISCSFCGKNHHQVEHLVAGPGVYICSSCIALCQVIIDEDVKPQ